MRRLRLLTTLALPCAVALQPAQAVLAAGVPNDPAEITQEIILRCTYDMGEFGEIGVEACIRADQAAVEALKRYPPEAQPIVDRCFQAKWTQGYSMVQQCVEAELGKR